MFGSIARINLNKDVACIYPRSMEVRFLNGVDAFVGRSSCIYTGESGINMEG